MCKQLMKNVDFGLPVVQTFVFQSLGRTVQVIAHVRTALNSAYALMSHSMP